MACDQIMVKESPGLCRCCLSEGCYKDMATEYTWMTETEVYADMLLECFDISISQHPNGPNGSSRLICEVCITRLRDACNFKKQVQDAECKFVDLVAGGHLDTKGSYDRPLKNENISEETPEELEVEYLEDIDFETIDEDDMPLKPSTSKATTSTAGVKRGKRSRPKADVKQEKKAKVARLDVDKPKAAKTEKGAIRAALSPKTTLSSTKRNRLIKKNSIIVLESTTATPFKWHRQNYLCFFCHKPFKDTDQLKLHTKAYHDKSNIRAAVSYLRRDEKIKIDVTDAKCKLCDHKNENLNALVEHLKVNHDKCFFDDLCNGLVPYKLQHNSYQCAVCETTFPYFVKLNQHMNKHFGTYLCQKCGKCFLSEARLACHTLSHGSKFPCTTCEEVFDTLTQRYHHEAKEHKKIKKLQCLYCNDVFQNYNQRKKHHNESHNIKIDTFKCPECFKTFNIMSKMKAHFKEVHAREKNFTCVECEQKFFSRTHLQKHMIKHFGEKIHQCDVCKKSYARKQTLRDHMKVHSDEKKFKCYVCNQAFIRNNSLRLHFRTHLDYSNK